MALEFHEIVHIARARQIANSALIEKMLEVRQRYNGDWVVPYTSEEDSPAMPPLTPALIAESIDFPAMRAASVMPMLRSPAIDIMKETGVKSMEWAHLRRRSLGTVYHRSRMNLLLRRSFRHVVGYGTACMQVIPDPDLEMPRIVARDPLTCYPEPKAPEDLTPLNNAAFIYAKSAEWIRNRYPKSRTENGGPIAAKGTSVEYLEMWDLIEWVDAEIVVVGVLGPHNWQQTMRTPIDAAAALAFHMELSRTENRAGVCTITCPQRVTLDKIISQIGLLTGNVDLMARLQALQIMATEKAIFPDRYIIGAAGQAPKLVSGKWQYGRTGQVNMVENAAKIDELRSTPDPTNQQEIDRLERNVRISTGLVPQAGGESYGALRTGRGMDSMMGAAVDPRVQEAQEVMAAHLEYTNKAVFELWKGYWPDKCYQLFSGWQGDMGQFEFQPRKHIETSDCFVAYAVPGTDVQGTTIIAGQMTGAGLMSKHTARVMHPYIDNPELEKETIEMEAMESAVEQGMLQQVVQGQIPVNYVAKVYEKRKHAANLMEAINAADAEQKKEQAKTAPPPGPDQHAAPEQMPGISPPGVAPVPPGPPDQGPGPGGPGGPGGPPAALAGFRALTKAMSQQPAPEAPQPPQQQVVA